MNRLTSTEYWESLTKVTPKLTEELKYISDHLSDYAIPPASYKHLMEFRMYKYPMVRAVSRLVDKGVIVPALFSHPVNSKAKTFNVPRIFTIPTIANGKITIAADLSTVADYVRDRSTDAVQVLDCDPKSFYGFMQVAASAYLLTDKATSIKYGTFADKSAKLFTQMFTKVVDRIQPISHTEATYVTTTFLVMVYFYRVMFCYEVEDAFKMAGTKAPGGKDYLKSVAETITPENTKIENITDLLGAIEANVRTIRKGTLTIRAVHRNWVDTYGINAVYALEHYGSFLQMVQMANLWMGLFNDHTINNLAANTVRELEETLGSLE